MELSNLGIPATAVPVNVTSGLVANASAVATLPAVAGKLNVIKGVIVSGAGATLGFIATLTIAGLRDGTKIIPIAVPAGALLGVGPHVITLPQAIEASDVNVAITATLSAFGAGNTSACVIAQGYLVG